MFKDADDFNIHGGTSELDRQSARTLLYFGELAFDRGDYARALDLCERALALDIDLKDAQRLRRKAIKMCS